MKRITTKMDLCLKKTGVTVVASPSVNVKSPENVDSKTGKVFCHNECEIPMQHIGNEGLQIEYKCNSEPGQCQYSESCPQFRSVQMDQGMFQRIPFTSKGFSDALDIRKNCERSFNLLKEPSWT